VNITDFVYLFHTQNGEFPDLGKRVMFMYECVCVNVHECM
jgi:hypothetical protein